MHRTNMSLETKFRKLNWEKHWAGRWSLLTCSCLGYQYTKGSKKQINACLGVSIFISHKGFTVGYLDKEDKKIFGENLLKQIKKDKKVALYWCNQTKQSSDKTLHFLKEIKGKSINYEIYQRFLKILFEEYEPYHRAVKNVTDFLPEKLLKELLPKFSEARVYAEPVYEETEKFMQRMAKQISKKTGYPKDIILCTTKEEFDKYLKNGKLPKKEVLQKRYTSGALLFQNGKYEFITDKKVTLLEKSIEEKFVSQVAIKGTSAYPGKAKGTVKIIMNAREKNDFKKGDVLVTGMTRPEYVYLIKESSAFVTDAGGMLSHAAITARELKKPCIVGTQIATKTLKNGDLVEVDADKGIIKIVKQK